MAEPHIDIYKETDPKPVFYDIRHETNEVLKKLLDKLFYIILIFGGIAVTTSAMRVFKQGWKIDIIYDIVLYCVVIASFGVRRKMPVGVFSIILFTLTGLTAFGMMNVLGLAGESLLMLATVCVVACVYFGFKAALVPLVISLFGIVVFGAGFCTGFLEPTTDFNSYLRNPTTWIAHATGFVLYVIILCVATQSIQMRLHKSLVDLNTQADVLRESERKYRLITDNMTDTIYLFDMDLRLLYISPSVTEMFGYTLQEALLQGIETVVSATSLPLLKKNFALHMQQATKGVDIFPLSEYQFVRKDGSFFWGEVKTSFVYGPSGKPVALQGVLRDITQRKEMEKEKTALLDHLRQSEKMEAIGQLAGGVAHDFNNQLTGILCLADLLRREYSNDAVICDYANSIMKSAQRSADLTSKLLTYARKGPLDLIPVDMHGMVGEVVVVLQRSIVEKNIVFKQYLEANPSTVMGDPSLIQNALLNIAINARDAMPQGGHIVFASTTVEGADLGPGEGGQRIAAGQCIRLSISDNGTGMDEITKKRIFEPFFTTKSPEKGTGMGLAAVYGTITSHGGIITMESSPNKGSTFSIYLPIAKNIFEPKHLRISDELPKGSGKILIVDDEDSIRKFLSVSLQRTGYSILDCADGLGAIKLYEKHWFEIDLVLLDMMLPGANGRHVFETMRGINKNAAIVLMSGYDKDTDSKDMLNSGALGFLKKPFTLLDASQKVAETMRKIRHSE